MTQTRATPPVRASRKGKPPTTPVGAPPSGSAAEAGYRTGYRAELGPVKLGYGVQAFTRVTLAAPSETTAEKIAGYLAALPEVQQAYSLTRYAD